MKVISRIDMLGVAVPVRMELAEPCSEKERQAWDAFAKSLTEGLSMGFSIGTRPVEQEEVKHENEEASRKEG